MTKEIIHQPLSNLHAKLTIHFVEVLAEDSDLPAMLSATGEWHMATKIVREAAGPVLRDDKGRHTAISYKTKDVEVWISNTTVRRLSWLIVIIVAAAVGTTQSGLAEKMIVLVLRGAIG